jgi:putative lipoprotein
MSIRLLLVILATTVAVTFTGAAMAKDASVSGTVTYLNRSALPPGAVLEVELVDVSRADAMSVRMSSRRYAIDKVPFAFELAYDPELIDERYSYAIQARVSQGEKVLYRTTRHYPALTRNAPAQLDIVLDLMSEPSLRGLESSNWQVTEISGRLLVSDKRPAIRFLADSRVAIDTGCNKFTGPVTVSETSVVFSDKMAGTLMACVPPYDTLEKDMLAALPQITGWVRSGDQLALTNAAGMTVLRMVPHN